MAGGSLGGSAAGGRPNGEGSWEWVFMGELLIERGPAAGEAVGAGLEQGDGQVQVGEVGALAGWDVLDAAAQGGGCIGLAGGLGPDADEEALGKGHVHGSLRGAGQVGSEQLGWDGSRGG